MNFSPAIKGLITAAAMVAVPLIVYYAGTPADSPVQFLVYIFYGAGLVWTLLAYRNTDAFTGKFSESFSQGFKCFVVITLVMVLFTFLFSKMHPEFAEQSVAYYKEEQLKLLKKGDILPGTMEENVSRYKKGYPTALIYGAIISYLIIGAGVTAILSVLLNKKNR